MLSGLQMLTFFFPLESTERVPEATSILLSVIVFQTMIVDQLPRSSNSIPLLCIYVDMLTGISVLAVAEAVIVASLVSRKGLKTKAPKWTHRFLKFIYKWNNDPTVKRQRGSVAFLRNSLAFFSSANRESKRRKTVQRRNPDLVLENINTTRFDAVPVDSGESMGYDIKPTSSSTSRKTQVEDEAAGGTNNTYLKVNGMLGPQVKFLPSKQRPLRSVGESVSSISPCDESPRFNRKDFDVPLAEFDPESSMVNSSIFGSIGPGNFSTSIVAPLERKEGTDSFLNDSDDLASLDRDVWPAPTPSTPRIGNERIVTLSSLSTQARSIQPKLQRSTNVVESSPLLTRTRLVSHRSRHISTDSTGEQQMIKPHRQSLQPVSSASIRFEKRESSLSSGTSIKRQSTVGNEQDFGLTLPGLPKAPCMRRSRPSLFIPGKPIVFRYFLLLSLNLYFS